MKYILIFGLLAISFVSCRKKQDTIVEITVKSNPNEVVSGAHVKLFTQPPYSGTSSPILEMEGSTGENGIVRFNFNDIYQLGQAGVAVLNVEVKKGDLDGSGIIKVDQEKVSKKVVLIQ